MCHFWPPKSYIKKVINKLVRATFFVVTRYVRPSVHRYSWYWHTDKQERAGIILGFQKRRTK